VKIPDDIDETLRRLGEGDLAGGEKAELWGWNGVQEQLIDALGDCSF
jgi:hypothetical protein